MVKPILTIKQKCTSSWSGFTKYNTLVPASFHPKDCKCKGTGEITKSYTPLRDVEKICNNCKHDIDYHSEILHHRVSTPFRLFWSLDCRWNNCDCIKPELGYKIPFKDYEIKKVSEIAREGEAEAIHKKIGFKNWSPNRIKEIEFWFREEHNLKEDDKVVIA